MRVEGGHSHPDNICDTEQKGKMWAYAVLDLPEVAVNLSPTVVGIQRAVL